AWTKARGQLEAAGIVLTEAPLFLVLGRSGGSLESLFAATRMPFQVRHAPREEPAPLHVYASRDAIFVTCEGASLLPVQAARLAEALLPPPPTGPAPLSDLLGAGGEAPAAPADGGESAQPQPATQGAVLLLGEPEPAPGEQPVTARRTSLLKDE